MKIKITEQEAKVLREVSSKKAAYSCVSIEDGVLEVSDEVVDHLRDACSDYLQEVGFDEDYKPTAAGKALESLIDKLFMG